jgi:VWFA-related protein
LLIAPRPISRFLLLLAATTFAVAAAPSFQFSTSSSNSIQAQNPQNPPEHTLKIDAKLVPIRVVVRDSSGRAVGSLTKDDFQISDNGKPQVISQFFTEQTAGSPSAAPSNEATPESQPLADAKKPASKIFTLYLIDDLHLEPPDMVKTREGINRQVAHLAPSERAAIFTTSRQVQLDFTTDQEKLRATVDRLKASKSGAASCPLMTYYMADLIQNRGDQATAERATEDALNCAFDGNPKAENAARTRMKSAVRDELAAGRLQTDAALRILKDLVQGMSKAPGSRMIVLISPGIFCEQYDTEGEILDLAVRGDVIVSAVDPSGLGTFVSDISATSDLSVQSRLASTTIAKQSQTEARALLSDMADATGGTFFRNNNDLDAGLRSVATPPEYSYILAFSPDDASLDGKFHKLKITLRQPEKLTVQARHRYFATKRGS